MRIINVLQVKLGSEPTLHDRQDRVTAVLMVLQHVTAELELYVHGEPLSIFPLDLILKAESCLEQAKSAGANPDTLKTYSDKFPLLFGEVRKTSLLMIRDALHAVLENGATMTETVQLMNEAKKLLGVMTEEGALLEIVKEVRADLKHLDHSLELMAQY